MSGPRIYSPLPGISVWVNPENGARCSFVHWTADPIKDLVWAQGAAQPYGGMQTPEWQQEMEGNLDARRGTSVYPAFSRDRNLVEGFHVPREWEKWLSADFGYTDATCILFWARDPRSRRKYIWHEVYVVGSQILDIKRDVYRFVGDYYDTAADAVNLDDLGFEYNVGDPSGPGKIYRATFAHDPLPIYFHGNPKDGNWIINDRGMSERRGNTDLLPTFFCCGKRQHTRNAEPTGRCEVMTKQKDGNLVFCGKAQAAPPMVMIMTAHGAPCAPNLVRQFPMIIRAAPHDPSMPTPEKNIKCEDHAVDAYRLGIMRDRVDEPASPDEAATRAIMETPPDRLSYDQLAVRDRLMQAKPPEVPDQNEEFLEMGELDHEGDFYSGDEAPLW